MDAVENVSLQISHSTSSHNDLYVLGLRKKKKKRCGEREKISVISFFTSKTIVNKVSACPFYYQAASSSCGHWEWKVTM